MPLRLCVLLWERAGRGEDLTAFEDAVLRLLPIHGGRLVTRDRVVDRHEGDPFEVQSIELPDEAALSSFLGDPRRADLAGVHDRDAVIARTLVLRVETCPDDVPTPADRFD